MEMYWLTGEATATCGSVRRKGASLAEMGAPLTPLKTMALLGRTIRSAPMPLFIRFWPVNWPIMMAMMVSIMMTSMATAKTLMMERRGRCSRLAKMSLFIPGRGSELFLLG